MKLSEVLRWRRTFEKDGFESSFLADQESSRGYLIVVKYFNSNTQDFATMKICNEDLCLPMLRLLIKMREESS